MNTDNLTMRAGRPEDHAQIVEMTKGIWGGDDYLPHVWHSWLEEPRSHLQVVEVEGEIVASGRIQELSPGYWWLEGLRVHPGHQGKGYATPLHNHLVGLAASQPGATQIALATDWDNEKVAHLSRKSGMELQVRYRFFKGEVMQTAVAAVEEITDVSPPVLHAMMHESNWLQSTGGYLMWGWVATPATVEWVAARLAEGKLYRYGDALLLGGGGSRGGRSWVYWTGGGTPEAQSVLVRHARHALPTDDGFLRAFTAPDEEIMSIFREAGMHDPEDGEFYLNHFVKTV